MSPWIDGCLLEVPLRTTTSSTSGRQRAGVTKTFHQPLHNAFDNNLQQVLLLEQPPLRGPWFLVSSWVTRPVAQSLVPAPSASFLSSLGPGGRKPPGSEIALEVMWLPVGQRKGPPQILRHCPRPQNGFGLNLQHRASFRTATNRSLQAFLPLDFLNHGPRF